MEDCFLQRPLPPLHPNVRSTALCPLYGPLSPLLPYVLSKTLCLFHGPMSPLRLYATSTALSPLFDPVSGLRPYVPPPLPPLLRLIPSTALSVPSTASVLLSALCALYGPLSPL